MEKLAFRVLKDDLALRRRALADHLGCHMTVVCLTTRNREGQATSLTETTVLINDALAGGNVGVNLMDIECVFVEAPK